MNVQALKKRAKRMTKERSIIPDMEYIFSALFISLTIIGLPIAYCIMKEYHKYLITCRQEFDGSKKSEVKKVYGHKHVTQLMFEYNWDSVKRAVKTIFFVLLPGSVIFDMRDIRDSELFEQRLLFTQMKMHFYYIYIYEILIILAIAMVFIYMSVIVTLICVGAIVGILAVMFKPFVVYCQTIVIVEKMAVQRFENSENE